MGYRFLGAEGGDIAGASVAAAGDVDNDGRADLMIGASKADGGSDQSGEAYPTSGADLAAACSDLPVGPPVLAARLPRHSVWAAPAGWLKS
jgi:hypothetical protein